MTHFSGLFAQSIFTLIRFDDGSYALQTPSGNYVTAVGGGGIANGDNLRTDATQIQAWEKFRIVDQAMRHTQYRWSAASISRSTPRSAADPIARRKPCVRAAPARCPGRGRPGLGPSSASG